MTRSRKTRSTRTTSPSSIRVRIRAPGHTRATLPTLVATASLRSTFSRCAWSTPASMRDMSRRFAMRALSRSASESISSSTSRCSSFGPCDLVVEQIGDVRLDRRERAPEIVRDGREQGLPQTFRLPVDLGSGGGPQQPVPLEDEGELVAERAEDPALRGCRRVPLAAEHQEPDVVRADAEREAFGGTLRRARVPFGNDLAGTAADRDLLAQSSGMRRVSDEQRSGVVVEHRHDEPEDLPIRLLVREGAPRARARDPGASAARPLVPRPPRRARSPARAGSR